ncbi:MAG: helix-turn-helix domain-containing protein [Tannerella sp.]|nr:helix-turn-helix domain-containing protein [Tannerella sp.]
MTYRAFVIARNEAIQRAFSLDCFVPRNDVVPVLWIASYLAMTWYRHPCCLVLPFPPNAVDGNISSAAEMLGISRYTLYRKINNQTDL